MRKQELIHLHGLLSEVEDLYEQRTSSTIDLEEYESMGVRPTSIHRSKTDHKAAVFALSSGITEAMAAETAEPVTAD